MRVRCLDCGGRHWHRSDRCRSGRSNYLSNCSTDNLLSPTYSRSPAGSTGFQGHRNGGRALGAKGNPVVVIAVGIRCTRETGRRDTWNDGWPSQDIGKSKAAGIANVITEIVRDRHIFDRLIKPLACITCLQRPLGTDGPIETEIEGVALHWFHLGLDGWILRIGLRRSKILILNEPRAYAWSRTGSRAACAEVQSRCDCVVI